MSNQPVPRLAPSWWRILLRWTVGLLGVYAGVLVLLMLLESRLVYFPFTDTQHWVPPPSRDVEDVWLTTSDGGRIHGWWLPHPGADSTLLYLHGNAGNLSHRGQAVRELHDALGVSVLIIDYPGFGKSPGSPSEAGCYQAADAAYDWLTGEKKIAPERIILHGKSLGGGVAVDVASRKDHRALVLVKTYTTLPDVGASHYPWAPVRWLMRNRFDSLSKIGNCRRPVFVAHGDVDEVIPYALGEQLYAAANEPKEFLPLPGVMHNDPLPAAFYTKLRQFLDRHAP